MPRFPFLITGLLGGAFLGAMFAPALEVDKTAAFRILAWAATGLCIGLLADIAIRAK